MAKAEREGLTPMTTFDPNLDSALEHLSCASITWTDRTTWEVPLIASKPAAARQLAARKQPIEIKPHKTVIPNITFADLSQCTLLRQLVRKIVPYARTAKN